MEVKLSQYARELGEDYTTYYRKFKRGELPNARQSSTGAIMVKLEDKHMPDTLSKKNYNIPEIKYENISIAEDTRKNKSGISEITNRFANIDSGVVPFYDSSFQGNKSGITVRDCIILINKAYHNFSVVKNIIELLTEFSSGEILFKGGNKKSRDFFKSYLRKININSFQASWFREYYRSGNVFTYMYKKKIDKSDVLKISSVYGSKLAEAEESKVTLPSEFIILNPIDISVGNAVTFLRPIYNKILNSYELQRLRQQLNDTDKEAYESLPSDVKKLIDNKKNRTVQIPLSTDDVIAVFNAKQHYEALALPPFFSVLDDLDFKSSMRKMDIATMKLINQAILLVTTGAEPEKGGINPQNITNLQQIFLNESVGRVLIADYTTKATFVIPPIAEILDPKKYEAINNDIYVGLNYILLGDEKFANAASKIQIFVERLNHARQIFLDEFLCPVIKRISKDLGFKNYPEPYFVDIDLKNDVEWARIYTQLATIGFITPEEAFNALSNGQLPLSDESLEHQQEFKNQKAKGLYQPVAGGPANQMDVLKQTGKQQMDLQENMQQHDLKMTTKQHKHEAANPPPAPPPAIHIGTNPKVTKEPNGRPAGSKRQQSTKKPRVSGAEDILFSGKKVIDNVLALDKLNKIIVSSIQEKYNLKSLTQTQLNLAKELADIIVLNEDIENWESSIASYIEKPEKYKNTERIEEISQIADRHQIDLKLAAILYASQAEQE